MKRKKFSVTWKYWSETKTAVLVAKTIREALDRAPVIFKKHLRTLGGEVVSISEEGEVYI